MIGTMRVVTHDLFDIATRVKEIDPAYFIVRNYKARRYELHAADQRGGSLALVLPYAELDARTLSLARKTRAERADALIRESEAYNARLMQAEQAKIVRRMAEAAGL